MHTLIKMCFFWHVLGHAGRFCLVRKHLFASKCVSVVDEENFKWASSNTDLEQLEKKKHDGTCRLVSISTKLKEWNRQKRWLHQKKTTCQFCLVFIHLPSWLLITPEAKSTSWRCSKKTLLEELSERALQSRCFKGFSSAQYADLSFCFFAPKLLKSTKWCLSAATNQKW